MIRKTKIIFSLLLISFSLFGMLSIVSAEGSTCIEESYDSGWLNIGDYVYAYSGDAGLTEDYWYIDSGTGSVMIRTPSLNFAETYNFYFKYGIGTGNDLDTEDFQIVCGGQTFDFPDDVLTDNPQTLTKSISCNLESGVNYIEFKSTNTGSVHLYEFKLIGEKTCPPIEPVCGNGVKETGEACDDGNSVSGDGCSSTCNLESFCPLNPADYDEIVTIDQKLVSKTETTSSKFNSDVIPVSLSSGEYSITLVARDYYSERSSATQPKEQYKIIFIKDSSQVAVTPSTSDLQDYVAFAQITEIVVGDLLLPNGADSIQAFHSEYDNIPTSSPNSVDAVCVGIKKIEEPTSPTPVCGNGIKETGEQCDDGNTNNFDECRNDCTLPYCGDELTDVFLGEECDFGTDNGVVCNPLYGDTCNWCNNNCELITETGGSCGDGTCDAEEDCSTCEEDCGLCPPIEPVCGNGVKETGEACDLGTNNGVVCDPAYGETCDWCSCNCELITETGSSCGDGTCDSEEDCETCEEDCGECEDEDEDTCNNCKTPLILKHCNPNWECSGWSECSGGVMTRTCTDNNFCEVEYNKPNEVTACDVTEQVKEPASNNNLFWFFIGIILLIILLIILVNLLR
jgi:cysteine-rich repeat protein